MRKLNLEDRVCLCVSIAGLLATQVIIIGVALEYNKYIMLGNGIAIPTMIIFSLISSWICCFGIYTSLRLKAYSYDV